MEENSSLSLFPRERSSFRNEVACLATAFRLPKVTSARTAAIALFSFACRSPFHLAGERMTNSETPGLVYSRENAERALSFSLSLSLSPSLFLSFPARGTGKSRPYCTLVKSRRKRYAVKFRARETRKCRGIGDASRYGRDIDCSSVFRGATS